MTTEYVNLKKSMTVEAALSHIRNVAIEKETIYTEEVDLILEGKSKDEILEYMNKKIKEQQMLDEKIKKQQEIEKKILELQQKIKTAEFYYKSGKISKEDYDRLLKAKEEKLKEIDALQKEKDELNEQQSVEKEEDLKENNNEEV